MAKATATCTCTRCGRTYYKTKTCYNRREADDWTTWMETHYTGLCEECYKLDREERRAAADEAFAAGHPLPDLVGSEKQVAWATTIRREALEPLYGIRDKVEPAALERFDAVVNWLAGQTACRWWIDNRGDLETSGAVEDRAYRIWGRILPMYEARQEG